MGATSELFIEMQDELINTVHRAEEGEISILDALLELEANRKPLEDSLAIIKSFKNEQIHNIQNEASEHKEGYLGYMIEVRNGGKMFNFKEVPEWQTYNKAVKECEGRYKSIVEAKLKGSSFADVDENGERMILPIISYRKSSVIIKEKKR